MGIASVIQPAPTRILNPLRRPVFSGRQPVPLIATDLAKDLIGLMVMDHSLGLKKKKKKWGGAYLANFRCMADVVALRFFSNVFQLRVFFAAQFRDFGDSFGAWKRCFRARRPYLDFARRGIWRPCSIAGHTSWL